MNYKEYGIDNEKTIILLHGGGLSWWNFRREAELLQHDYHVILPILDGHAGSNRRFTSIEDNAAEIISFMDEHLGGSVYFIGGLSLGAQILLEILSQRAGVCEHAIIESAAAIPSKVTHALIRPSILCSCGLIRQRWFAKLQFKSLKMNGEFFGDYYRDTCKIEKEDMIAFLKANTAYEIKDSIKNCTADVHIFYGAKEIRSIKKSAQLINNMLPNSTLTELPGLFHGEFSLNHAAEYSAAVLSFR